MTPVTLDFTACTAAADFYREMREKMEWESWYGENLDALWDILTGMPYRGDDFLILRRRFYPAGETAPGWYLTERADKICAVFKEAQSTGHKLTVRIWYADGDAECEQSHGS